MRILGINVSKRQEVLKTDEVRRMTHAEVAKTKNGLDQKFAHLSRLVDETLTELKVQKRQPSLHPNNRRQ